MDCEKVVGYIPKDGEEYMSDRQVEYFRGKIARQKMELSAKVRRAMSEIRELKAKDSDILDRSNTQLNIEMAFSSFERYSDLVRQYDKALERIEEGCFGFCEITGMEIGLRRLEVHPCATLSVEAQQRSEESERRLGGGNKTRLWSPPI